MVTDHHALCVLNSGEPKSGRLQRWDTLLQMYKFEIVYTRGDAVMRTEFIMAVRPFYTVQLGGLERSPASLVSLSSYMPPPA